MPDRLLSWAGFGMIAAALYLLVFGGPGDADPDAAAVPPPLELVEASVWGGVLTIRFDAAAPISLQPGGWGTNGLHLHARLDGTEVMPGAAEIRRLPDGRYDWSIRLPTMPPETVTLYWADAAHRAVGGTEQRRPLSAASSGRAQN